MIQIWKRALNSLVSHMHSIHCNHKVGLRADVSPDVVALLVCVCLFYVYANKTVEWMAAVQIRVQWFWQTHSWHFIVRHDSGRDEWILVDHEVKYGVIQEDQLVSVSAHISWWLDYSSMRQKESAWLCLLCICKLHCNPPIPLFSMLPVVLCAGVLLLLSLPYTSLVCMWKGSTQIRAMPLNMNSCR